MTPIWGFVLIVTVFGCIPYGIWMIYTLIKKRWKRLVYQITIPIVIILLLMTVTQLVNRVAYEQYLDGLYDTQVELGDPIFEYHSERSFNGDGYSISIYELPTTVRRRFEAADERLLVEFPKHPSYRNHWSFEHWRKSPFDPNFAKYLDFALSPYDSARTPGLAERFESIRRILSSDNAYYAFFYYSHGNDPGDIDLFIVDLDGNRLYRINHNT